MVLTAHRAATSSLRGLQSNPVLCELSACSTLPAILKTFDPAGTDRVLLFLGTIHNYEPEVILRSLLHVVRTQDQLLVSANLAPAARYEEALGSILKQYDNPATRAWLMGALSELDLTESVGDLVFELVSFRDEFKAITARFIFSLRKTVTLFGQEFIFETGDKLKVFVSRRFTSDQIRKHLEHAGLKVQSEWVTQSEEEGTFLCCRS
jgi:uncharacterized SAM-dependent methyltransferase